MRHGVGVVAQGNVLVAAVLGEGRDAGGAGGQHRAPDAGRFLHHPNHSIVKVGQVRALRRRDGEDLEEERPAVVPHELQLNLLRHAEPRGSADGIIGQRLARRTARFEGQGGQ